MIGSLSWTFIFSIFYHSVEEELLLFKAIRIVEGIIVLCTLFTLAREMYSLCYYKNKLLEL
jgi:hypothetical protein